MIRAHTGRASSRSARFPFWHRWPKTSTAGILAGIAATVLVACGVGPTAAPAESPGPAASVTASGAPVGSEAPSTPAPETPGATAKSGATGTPSGSGGPPGTPAAACSGSDANREFFRQAAASMAWPVYCAALPDGWFLETGAYRLADGGRLEATYRGPGDAHLAIVEGNACAGSDVDACAPRDALIGPSAFGDREGELGQLANGLVLDLERGASPSWRVTGLGLSEQAFRDLCAALVLVEG